MKSPEMRLNVESAIGELASEEIQAKIWPAPLPFCGFDLVVHILFDDMNIREYDLLPEDMALNHDQRQAVLDVMDRLEMLWGIHGIDANPDVLRADPRWHLVVDAAERYFEASDSPKEFQEHVRSAEQYGKAYSGPHPFPSDESE